MEDDTDTDTDDLGCDGLNVVASGVSMSSTDYIRARNAQLGRSDAGQGSKQYAMAEHDVSALRKLPVPWLPAHSAAADLSKIAALTAKISELVVQYALNEGERSRLASVVVELERDNAVLRRMVTVMGREQTQAPERVSRFPTLAQMAGDGVPR